MIVSFHFQIKFVCRVFKSIAYSICVCVLCLKRCSIRWFNMYDTSRNSHFVLRYCCLFLPKNTDICSLSFQLFIVFISHLIALLFIWYLSVWVNKLDLIVVSKIISPISFDDLTTPNATGSSRTQNRHNFCFVTLLNVCVRIGWHGKRE